MPIGSSDYTEIMAAVAADKEDELFDNVAVDSPTMDLFREFATSTHGRLIELRVRGGKNESTTRTDDSGTFNATLDGSILGVVKYDFSDIYVSHTRVATKTLAMIGGEEEIVDLANEQLNAAVEGHRDELVGDLFARVAYGESDHDDGAIYGLDALTGDAAYDADPAGDGSIDPLVVGGVDTSQTQNEFWQAVRREYPVDGSVDVKNAFRKMANALYVGSRKRPSHLIVGEDLYDEYESSLDEAVRYHQMDSGETRFTELRFSNLVVRLDPDCNPKRGYFLYRPSWRFKHLPNFFMRAQDTQKVPGTLDSVTPLASILGLGVNERGANGVLLRPDTAGGDA